MARTLPSSTTNPLYLMMSDPMASNARPLRARARMSVAAVRARLLQRGMLVCASAPMSSRSLCHRSSRPKLAPITCATDGLSGLVGSGSIPLIAISAN
jgi:hypothetical protein